MLNQANAAWNERFGAKIKTTTCHYFQKSPSSPNLPILYAFLFLVFTQFMWATLNATYHSRSGFQKINPHPLHFAAPQKRLNSTQKLKNFQCFIFSTFYQFV
jgi:hypothetical protein